RASPALIWNPASGASAEPCGTYSSTNGARPGAPISSSAPSLALFPAARWLKKAQTLLERIGATIFGAYAGALRAPRHPLVSLKSPDPSAHYDRRDRFGPQQVRPWLDATCPSSAVLVSKLSLWGNGRRRRRNFRRQFRLEQHRCADWYLAAGRAAAQRRRSRRQASRYDKRSKAGRCCAQRLVAFRWRPIRRRGGGAAKGSSSRRQTLAEFVRVLSNAGHFQPELRRSPCDLCGGNEHIIVRKEAPTHRQPPGWFISCHGNLRRLRPLCHHACLQFTRPWLGQHQLSRFRVQHQRGILGTEFCKMKLEQLKLSEEPCQFRGLFSIGDADRLPCRLAFEYNAFDTAAVEAELSSRAFAPAGRAVKFHSLDSFKALDKQAFADQLGAELLSQHPVRRGVHRPARLLDCFHLPYVDLKKYHFYYWLCMPVLAFPPKFRLCCLANASLAESAAVSGGQDLSRLCRSGAGVLRHVRPLSVLCCPRPGPGWMADFAGRSQAAGACKLSTAPLALRRIRLLTAGCRLATARNLLVLLRASLAWGGVLCLAY
uniref:ATG7_N domain-containing protein n=1 Tax=Macrostomum lignano TaxID=282301 RepID=A0A1I8F8D6_9PLAT